MQISQEDSDSHQMVLPKCNPTKRRSRTSSPENSSCSAGGGGGGVYRSSAATSICNEDEDEALANCLILLAAGGGTETEDAGDVCPALVAGGGGETYPDVYQCKTCGRNFPSFQALGGHRASHKKPKIGFTAAGDEKEGPLSDTVGIGAPKNSKAHECTVCGSEFASGQALGGHMRRHRPIIHQYSTAKPHTGSYGATHGRGMILAIDLNLPPPPPEEEEEDGGGGGGGRHDLKMRNLAFSTPAPLVDCHY